jgi:two-component system NtrC family sensor kinase
LRDFSRQSPEDAEAIPSDLNAMVHEALSISRPRFDGTEVVLQLGSPPLVLMRPADCVTAIVNLLFNAMDALDSKGIITISTGDADRGGWVEVADNGPGIPEHIKTRILEPFFTTKGNLGTGLGIPIVYAFTQRHGGRLEIESESGHGAKFKMWFPAAQSS